MVKCLICTIIIELFVGYILKVRNKKDQLNIILANIITNPIVVSVPVLMLVYYGYNFAIITLIILEIITVITEGYIYKKVLNYKSINPYLISLILNISSYLIGELINKI